MNKVKASHINAAVPHLKCLDKFRTNMRNLATGTEGVVYYGCEKKDVCYAIKIQLLESDNAIGRFNNEVVTQKAFRPMAPTVHTSCVEECQGNTFGVIVMQLIGEELDKYLVAKRTDAELDAVIDGITKIVNFLRKKKFTHGDLALFNIAYLPDREKLIMIDFDISSTKVYRPLVDVLRLLTEWNTKTRSKGTKKMNVQNVAYIIANGIPVWSKLAPISQTSNKDRADAWSTAYDEYYAEIMATNKSKSSTKKNSKKSTKKEIRRSPRLLRDKQIETKKTAKYSKIKKSINKKRLSSKKKSNKKYPKTPQPGKKRKHSKSTKKSTGKKSNKKAKSTER